MRHFKTPYWEAQATVNGRTIAVVVTVRQAPTVEDAAKVFAKQFGIQPTRVVRI